VFRVGLGIKRGLCDAVFYFTAEGAESRRGRDWGWFIVYEYECESKSMGLVLLILSGCAWVFDHEDGD